MDQDDRNAALYALAAKELEEIKRDRLAAVEAAAASGDANTVIDFAREVQAILSAEHASWAFPRSMDEVPTTSD